MGRKDEIVRVILKRPIEIATMQEKIWSKL